MTESSDLHVLKIAGNNFANLKVVDVTFDRGINRIGGANRAGKSNLMQLIRMIGGKSYIPAVPKTLDARKGSFEVSLADDDRNVVYVVKYSFTEKNPYITVVDAEGAKVGFDVLKGLLSPCLNPFEFYENATATGPSATTRKARALDVVKELMVIEFDARGWLSEIGFAEDARAKTLLSEHDVDPLAFLSAMDEYLMGKRKEWKMKVIEWEGAQTALEDSIPPELGDCQFVSIDALLAEQEEVQAAAIRGAQALQKALSMEEEVTKLEADLIMAKQRLEAFRKENENVESDMKLAEKSDKIKEKIAEITETNEIAQKVVDLKAMDEKVKNGEAFIEKATGLIEGVRDKRVELMESAKMPVKGLTIEGDTIMKNGLPLGQDSTEEGLTDAFLIGIAKFKTLAEDEERLMTLLIPNASLMGKKATEHMYKLAGEHGVQLILELVMDERENGVIFVEDGVAKTEVESEDV